MAARPTAQSEKAALSLAMAVVSSAPGPLLLVDGDLEIVAASAAFSVTFGIDAAEAIGRPLASLGSGEWGAPQLGALLLATVSGGARIEAHEMDLRLHGQPDRHLIIHAQRLVYLDLENIRLLIAICDVTDSRANAKLQADTLRQNLVLLQEVRHRVANSLQIIASVLMHSARKTGSDETRDQLKDAHHRVMSIAALERQLATTGESDVELHAYFSSLCENISASMIGDRAQIALNVTGTGGVVEARVSVSLGLIVTELVINALKHAFPNGRVGAITVDCAFRGPNWVLSVSDDGIGMPTDPKPMHTGLGTSIVRALAQQLLAVVEIEPAHPGTRVTITRTQIALVDDVTDPIGEAPSMARPSASGGGS